MTVNLLACPLVVRFHPAEPPLVAVPLEGLQRWCRYEACRHLAGEPGGATLGRLAYVNHNRIEDGEKVKALSAWQGLLVSRKRQA